VKRYASVVAIAAFTLTPQLASADDAPTPPAGWEVPSLPGASSDKPPKEKKKKIGPACCAFDSTCCSRQAEIDATARPFGVVRVFPVQISEMPEAVIKEAAEGAPLIEGAPPVRLLNEQGQRFPFPDPPKEIRMVPPGPLGELEWNAEWGAAPTFEDPELQSLGFGSVHYPKEKTKYSNETDIAGKVSYVSISQGEGDKLALDIVKGMVAGSPAVKATYYLHVEATNVADKIMHVYRSTTKEKDVTTMWLNFLMPQVIEGFESVDAKHQGALFPSRFSRTWSYSLYRLPYGPGRSNMATFRMNDYYNRRWIGVSKARTVKFFARNAVITVSQTSVEAEPRASVMFLDDVEL
jgi:hypothetical protein